MIARLALIVVLSAGLQGCVGAFDAADRIMREGGQPESGMSRRREGAENDREVPRSRGGFGRKRVVGKTEFLELVAEDGTRCQVSVEKVERVVPGQRVWCRWHDPMEEASRSS